MMIFNNSLEQWTAALIVACIATGFLFLLQKRVLQKLQWKTHNVFLIIVGCYVGTLVLEIGTWPSRLMLAVFALQVGLWGNEILVYLIRHSRSWDSEDDPLKSSSLAVINFAGKMILWSIVLIFFLSNLGFNVSALVTGLGIGGIAVALAVQNVLGDLFASLSILIDKPFAMGDLVVVDSLKGYVEHIGLKTTRLRTMSGEQAIFSNADLLKKQILNYKRMVKRRVDFYVDIHTKTSPQTLRKIPEIIKKIVAPLEKTSFDYAHFFDITNNSYRYEVVYHIDVPETGFYLKTQEMINLGLIEQFQKEGIEFAPSICCKCLE